MNHTKVLSCLLGAVLLGCGGDDNPTEPSTPDADVSPDGAVAADVTFNLNVPAAEIPAGTRILFLNPDDSVVADVAAASGSNSAPLFTGGSVVLVLPMGPPVAVQGGGSMELYAYLDVKAGETLDFSPIDDSTPGPLRTITAPAIKGATNYRFATTCASTSSNMATAQLQLDGCGATTDVAIAAFGTLPGPVLTGGGGGDVLIGTILARGVSTAADIDLSAQPLVPPSPYTLNVTGLRPSVSNASIQASVQPGADWGDVADLGTESLAPFAGGALSLTGPAPAFADAFAQNFVITFNNTANPTYYQRIAATDRDDTLDLAAVATPWLQGAFVDAKTSTLRIITSGAGAWEIGAGYLDLSPVAPPVPVAGGPQPGAEWYFSARIGADGEIRLPTLPAAYAAANVTAESGATRSIDGGLNVLAGSSSLDDLFARLLNSFGDDERFGDRLVALSGAGFGQGFGARATSRAPRFASGLRARFASR